MKNNIGYRMMHEFTGDDRTISEAERILLEAFADIRRAEKSDDYAHELDAWAELRGNVAILQSGRTIEADPEEMEGVDLARLIVRFIARRVAEDKKTWREIKNK